MLFVENNKTMGPRSCVCYVLPDCLLVAWRRPRGPSTLPRAQATRRRVGCPLDDDFCDEVAVAIYVLTTNGVSAGYFVSFRGRECTYIPRTASYYIDAHVLSVLNKMTIKFAS